MGSRASSVGGAAAALILLPAWRPCRTYTGVIVPVGFLTGSLLGNGQSELNAIVHSTVLDLHSSTGMLHGWSDAGHAILRPVLCVRCSGSKVSRF